MVSARAVMALGAVNGALAVVAGAFGAHALREQLADNLLRAFQTGAQYHMYHALALVLTGVTIHLWPGARALKLAATLFLLGIVLFSGSLYALALTGVSIIGAITPLGGLAFIAGWLTLAVGAWRGPQTP